ncbi:ARM repeat-containing protein [Thelephora ganbajun]|uniref:ARM repeat-containing protein n=1 Tax=Thelephora ganbajun TaxID=370292 RepID=A0ACB6ZZN0_THEGA|nr:ARM repeat-containing protein [Thelephora ganbajun]
MQSAHQPTPLPSFFDPLSPSSRQQPSNIWAPRAVSSDTTWPRSLDLSATRFTDRDIGQPRPALTVGPLAINPRTNEDVFGPVGFPANARNRGVGAVGDGRKNSIPLHEDRHVEQMLRFLNLNSPVSSPTLPLSSLSSTTNNTPDLSPVSATSTLMTPTDLSPATGFDKLNCHFDFNQYMPPSQSLLFETSPSRLHGPSLSPTHKSFYAEHGGVCSYNAINLPYVEPFPNRTSSAYLPQNSSRSADPTRSVIASWNGPHIVGGIDWLRAEDKVPEGAPSVAGTRTLTIPPFPTVQPAAHAHEPINFLSLLHPSSSPPYDQFVSRIIKSSDQQASIFLQQKLKVADADERAKIIDAICARGYEMMAHRFGNWAVQRCLEAANSADERRKVVNCMRGRVVELATNCYGCHVLQKALDCEEDVRLLIVSELLLGDPAQTLVNKHASHVWSKVMELTWTAPAPPIFAYVNKSLKGKWASLACHETGSLVVQHAFENLEEQAKDGIVDELLNRGFNVFADVAKNQWGSYCIQHILEHGSATHRQMALEHLVAGLLDFATHEQGTKSITKALKEGGKETLDRIIARMCEQSKGGRRAIIVDLALSVAGSQLIATVLPSADKDQRALLYESIRGHIVTLRGCKTGSKVIWLFDRMRAYYGY